MNSNDAPRATKAALREALQGPFGRCRAATVMTRLIERGLLPEGGKGRGVSREIDPKHAVLTLLALALDVHGDAYLAVEDAQRVMGFGLTAVDYTHVADGPPRRHHVASPDGLTFGDYLVTEIAAMRGAYPDYMPKSWRISGNEASQCHPTRLVFSGPLGDAIERHTVVPGAVLQAIADIFPPLPPPPTHGDPMRHMVELLREAQAAA